MEINLNGICYLINSLKELQFTDAVIILKLESPG